MGSMPKPSSMRGSKIKEAFGKARGMFKKRIPALGKSATAKEPVRKQSASDMADPNLRPTDMAASQDSADPNMAASQSEATDPNMADPNMADPKMPGPKMPGPNMAVGADIPRVQAPGKGGAGSGPNVGGKRNRYKKSKKGGRRTRKSRK